MLAHMVLLLLCYLAYDIDEMGHISSPKCVIHTQGFVKSNWSCVR